MNKDNKDISKQVALNEITTYTISGKTFIVQTIFKDTSKESIGTLLIKLMKSDYEK